MTHLPLETGTTQGGSPDTLEELSLETYLDDSGKLPKVALCSIEERKTKTSGLSRKNRTGLSSPSKPPSATSTCVKPKISNTEIKVISPDFKGKSKQSVSCTITRRKRHASESDSDSSVEPMMSDDAVYNTIEHDSNPYAANPLFAAGNKKFVDWHGKQHDIDSLWTKMAIMRNNYDLEVLHSFGLSLDRLQVNRDGFITGMILPKSTVLTPTEELFEIKDSDDGPIYTFRQDKIDTFSHFLANQYNISEFEVAFNRNSQRQLLFNKSQMESTDDKDDILVEDKLALLENILPMNENTVKIREKKGLNNHTGSGPNVQEFESWLINDQQRRPRTVEIFSLHIRRIMFYVQKAAWGSKEGFKTPADIDLEALPDSFAAAREYLLKLEGIPLRSCSLKNEWSSYMHLLKFARNKVISVVENFQRPGVAQSLTLHEFLHGKWSASPNDPTQKYYCISVRFHKTGECKPVQIALTESEFKHMYNYLNFVRPTTQPQKREKSTKEKKVPGLAEKTADRCHQFQFKGESDIEFAKRRLKQESQTEMNEEQFFLQPTSGRPIKNVPRVLRQYLAVNLHKDNRLPLNTPCWNATIARKLCEKFFTSVTGIVRQ